MENNIKENIEEYLVKLPKEVQETVRAFDWLSEVAKIAKENYLAEDHILDLQVITGLVLVNLSPLDTMPSKIESELGVAKDESIKIAQDIFDRVLNPVTDSVAKKLEEKSKNVNLDWGQNLNFILSGGNYLATMSKTEKTPIEANTKVSSQKYIEENLLDK